MKTIESNEAETKIGGEIAEQDRLITEYDRLAADRADRADKRADERAMRWYMGASASTIAAHLIAAGMDSAAAVERAMDATDLILAEVGKRLGPR